MKFNYIFKDLTDNVVIQLIIFKMFRLVLSDKIVHVFETSPSETPLIIKMV